MNNFKLQETLESYFPNLEESSLQRFTKHASFVTYTKGTKLISEGKKHGYFYLILKGGVKSYYWPRKSWKEMIYLLVKLGYKWPFGVLGHVKNEDVALTF